MRLKSVAVLVIVLATALACRAETPPVVTPHQANLLPTPDRSRVQIIDQEMPPGLTDPAATAAYQQGYAHMRDAA